MTAKAVTLRRDDYIPKTAAQTIAAGDIHQLADGRAAVYSGLKGAVSGDATAWVTEGQFTVQKTAGITILDGGKVFWDRSAGLAHFKAVADQDFYLGTAVGDASGSTVVVNLNVKPVYNADLAINPFVTAIVGTQALGGLALNRRGGSHNFKLSATNEAQKVDALGRPNEGFAIPANPIVELAFTVTDGSAGGNPHANFGIASGTHASDASQIAQRLFCRLDGNSTKIQFASADGTNTTAETDSTKTYTVGTRTEVWMDLRNPAAVALYVDGVQVLAATAFNVSAGAATWFLLAHVAKTAAADTFELDCEWLRYRIAEQ